MNNSRSGTKQLANSDGIAIELAESVDELSPPQPRLTCSSSSKVTDVGSCIWSADGSHFAWSCGFRIVRIISWTKYRTWKNSKTKASPAADVPSTFDYPEAIVIDAGELVSSLAFGSHRVHAKLGSTPCALFRYVVPPDLVLATGHCHGRIRTWDVRTGCHLLELVDHERSITDLSFTSEGCLRLLSACLDGCLKVWDFEDGGNMMKTLWSKSNSVFGCCWSPNGRMAASVGDYKSVLVWNMETHTILQSLVGHQHNVCKCTFSPDGALLATCSFDTRVIIWDVAGGTAMAHLCHLLPAPSLIFAGGANGCYVRSVTFSSDGQHIGTVCDDGFVRFWDISDIDYPVRVLAVNGALSCQFSPDGAILAVGTVRGSVLMLKSSAAVPTLQHMCRLSIRRHLQSTSWDDLCLLPLRLRQFLKYDFM